MSEKLSSYTVIDVETPNTKNDSICSIALVNVKDGVLISQEYYIIDPEDSFDDRNIKIHGINRNKVFGKPNFKVIWRDIEHYFTNGIIVAHNATFDLNVINKSLRKYEVDVPDFYYLCTLDLSRKCFLDFEKFRLDYLCSKFNIEMDQYHNALCDALSCQKLLFKIMEKIPVTLDNVQTFHFSDEYFPRVPRTEIVKSFNNLYGLIHGISCDRRINKVEVESIWNWMDSNRMYENVYPFNGAVSILKTALDDNEISENEKSQVLETILEFLPEDSFTRTTISLQILMGFLSGINCDQAINIDELSSLQEWLDKNQHLRGNYPYDAIIRILENVLSDGIITSEEESSLKIQFSQFTDPVQSKSDTKVIIYGKNVCLSGNFVNGTKEDIEQIITARDGIVVSSVSSKTNILVIGGEGSKDWSFSNYGTKAKRAMELRSKGSDILIIGEIDFLNSI